MTQYQYKNFKYSVNNEEITIRSVKKERWIVRIPKFILHFGKKLPVKRIGAMAFYRDKKIKLLIIPDNIQIGENAFMYSSIKKVIGNPSLVEQNAFADSPLEGKNIGKTFFVFTPGKKIPKNAIQIYGKRNCYYDTVDVPDNIKYISGFNNSYIDYLSVPSGCTTLNSLNINEGCFSEDCTIKEILNAKELYLGDNTKARYIYCDNPKLGNNCTIFSLNCPYLGVIPTSTKLTFCCIGEAIPSSLKIAYKGFDKGLICRSFMYDFDKVYTTEQLQICEIGFHACYDPLNCLNYYCYADNHEFHPVEILGNIQWDKGKIVTDKIKVLPQSLTLEDMIKIHNSLYEHC